MIPDKDRIRGSLIGGAIGDALDLSWKSIMEENRIITARVAVNHVGDCDTTGVIMGNILGATIGYEALFKSCPESCTNVKKYI